MTDLSIIIPSRKDPYLQQTINDILEKSKTDIEIIVMLDGYWPESLVGGDNLRIVHNGHPVGMRPLINAATRVANGKYLLKCDAHCCFAPGFDSALIAAAKDDTLLVPLRYDLDPDTWTKREPIINQMYITAPEKGFKGKVWDKQIEGDVIDLMTFQGSCWFMPAALFEKIGGEDEQYGTSGKEAQELGNKVWLSGGRVARHTGTWYAHHSFKRSYSLPNSEREKSRDRAIDIWTNDKWPGATRKFQWLIDKFNPPGWEVTTEAKAEREKMDFNTMMLGQKTVSINENNKMVQGLTRAGMYKLFASLGFKKGAEIGVQGGRNAWVMFENIPGLDMILVDPYEDHEYNPRKWRDFNHNKFKKQSFDRLKSYNVKWLYGYSEEMAKEVENESLDFVYIDGEHFYDFAMIDLILWLRKIKQGGVIAGHDYEYHKPKQFKVYKAVEHFAAAYGLSPIYTTDKKVKQHPGDGAPSFFIQKKGKLVTYSQAKRDADRGR